MAIWHAAALFAGAALAEGLTRRTRRLPYEGATIRNPRPGNYVSDAVAGELFAGVKR